MQRIIRKSCRRFAFQQDNDLKQWNKDNKVNVMEGPSQSSELRAQSNLESLCNFTELEQFFTEDWGKIAVSRCEKLIETCLHRLNAVITAKGSSTKY